MYDSALTTKLCQLVLMSSVGGTNYERFQLQYMSKSIKTKTLPRQWSIVGEMSVSSA